MKIDSERIIGSYVGEEKGPLLIIFGAMHGNEPAGVEALRIFFNLLEFEPIRNPLFEFRGKVIGLIGNLKAFQLQKRYINKDLNRIWTLEDVQRIKSNSSEKLDAEDMEMLALLEIIETEIENYQPSKLVILDLHTTSSKGGIFSIVTDHLDSLEIAIELHAPVIRGMLKGLSGTTLHYFDSENMGVPTTAVSFESGQHYENLSVNRAIAAITNCLRTIGNVNPIHIENKHDKILIEYSKYLPKVSELRSRHEIAPGDDFVMKPNYTNFQKVKKGEVLAKDRKGVIVAQEDARILMPLYQKQGYDGFFLVRELLNLGK